MSTKSQKKYNCINCCYYTDNKYDWDKHISRPKHIIKCGGFIPSMTKFLCECGKKYKYQSGLSRHKSKCKLQNKNEYCDVLKNITNGKLTTDEQLTAVLKVMMQQQETINKLIETQGEIIPKIGNNNNNKININVFLNERCKNAMNINEFISKIKVSMEDLDYTHNNGFVKGISNIFTKQLNDLEITERPIHCSNTKKLQFYIKDDDIWRKDTYHKKLNRMIRGISTKQHQQLKIWTEENPGFRKDQKLYAKYTQIIFNMIEEEEDEEKGAKDMIKIKKNIGDDIKLKGVISP
tara:strand:+ start:327 stop:1205 length:879 start_codon:yes stop_codon:yes gene_type:complete